MILCIVGRLICCFLNMVFDESRCLSGLSVDEFLRLPIQFGQVFKAIKFNRAVLWQ